MRRDGRGIGWRTGPRERDGETIGRTTEGTPKRRFAWLPFSRGRTLSLWKRWRETREALEAKISCRDVVGAGGEAQGQTRSTVWRDFLVLALPGGSTEGGVVVGGSITLRLLVLVLVLVTVLMATLPGGTAESSVVVGRLVVRLAVLVAVVTGTLPGRASETSPVTGRVGTVTTLLGLLRVLAIVAVSATVEVFVPLHDDTLETVGLGSTKDLGCGHDGNESKENTRELHVGMEKVGGVGMVDGSGGDGRGGGKWVMKDGRRWWWWWWWMEEGQR